MVMMPEASMSKAGDPTLVQGCVGRPGQRSVVECCCPDVKASKRAAEGEFGSCTFRRDERHARHGRHSKSEFGNGDGGKQGLYHGPRSCTKSA